MLFLWPTWLHSNPFSLFRNGIIKIRLKWEKQLKEENGLTLVPMLDNPIDEIWEDSERPARSKAPLEIIDVKYAGELGCFSADLVLQVTRFSMSL